MLRQPHGFEGLGLVSEGLLANNQAASKPKGEDNEFCESMEELFDGKESAAGMLRIPYLWDLDRRVRALQKD